MFPGACKASAEHCARPTFLQVDEFEDKQKELEAIIQPIMTRLHQGEPKVNKDKSMRVE